MEDVWYAYKGKTYNGELPKFYDPRNFEWYKLIHDNFSIIQEEIESYIVNQTNLFQPYFNSTLVEKLKSWKTSNFIFWSRKVDENCSKIPKTIELFQKIPGLTSMGISVLDSNSSIRPHHGDTNAILRCHLGLHIPAQAPTTALKVDDEIKGWKEGELMIFCDAWKHEAWNKADKPRYVLIFDVIHPEYLSQKRKICANVRSWLDLQKLYEKRPSYRKAPVFIKIFLRQWLRLKYMFG
jgi:ornithine lipid ester-linked acyl 2-hydroxylase